MICFILLNLLTHNFADDTTFYACDRGANSLINRLKNDSYLAIEWFENNSMKLNQDKCHLLVSGFKYENVWAKIGKTKIWESKKQKLLGVEIDRTVSFDEHIASLCRKAGKKLSRNYCFSEIIKFYVKK